MTRAIKVRVMSGCRVSCILYILVFASVIKLRYSQPDTLHPFKIPGGMAGVGLGGGLGACGTTFAFIVGRMPPSSFLTRGLDYVSAVLLGTFLLAVPPLVFLKFKNPSWLKPAGGQRWEKMRTKNHINKNGGDL